MRRVAVTGLGAVTPLGLGVRRSWKRLLDGESGIRSLKDLGFEYQNLQCQVAGLVPQGSKDDGAWAASDWLSRDDERRMAKFMQYAVVASQEALDDAHWHPKSEEDQEMTGVCMGSGIGSFEDVYNTSLAYAKGGAKKVSPLFVPRLLINLAAGHISMRHGFKGPSHAVTTACTTGAHSIGDAARFIEHGDADVMVAGGAESCIHPLAVTGFERSRSLTTSSNDDPRRASRPFHRSRDGFVISEGAGVMVLEELNHALNRNAPIHAILHSYATTSDAHHITAPPPSGQGAHRAMHLALARAGFSPREVSYINAHATSTPLGDMAENTAIKNLMLPPEANNSNNTNNKPTPPNGVNAQYWPLKSHPEEITIIANKSAIGHTLGAAGAIEGIFSVCSIQDQRVPPTLNLLQSEKDLDGSVFDCDYVPEGETGAAAGGRGMDVRVVLSNSFGFGGTNATLCFGRWEG